MTDKNEKRILTIIRYSPPIFIFLTTLFIAYAINNEYRQNIIEEKKQLRKSFIDEEKRRTELTTQGITYFLERTDHNKKRKLKQQLKTQIENAHNIATNIYRKYKGIKSKQEIKELIKDAIRPIRFLSRRGYFFIYEMNGTCILNSEYPKLEGKNLWSYKDAKGTYLFKEMNRLLKDKDEVFYDWYWNKPNDKSNDHLKVGFFKKFEPFNWYIGTGEYIRDFTKELKKESLQILQSQRFINDGYIFVFDKDGEFITTRHSKMIGENLHDLKILKELSMKFRNFIDSPESKRFIEYPVYKNINDKNPKNKISHMVKFDTWNWIIGTGFNVEDANEIIKQRQKLLEKKYNDYLKNLLIISSIFLIVMLIISYFISKYLEKIFNDYKNTLKNKNKNLLKAQKVAKLGDWKLDIDSGELYWSEELYKIFGLEKEQKISVDLVKSLVKKEYLEVFDKSLNTQNNFSCVYEIKPQDSKRKKWIDSKSQFNKYKNTVIGTIQDITETKELELEKLKKEKLLYQQSKMAAMGEMLSNIAHQWRQPLSTISTASTGVKLQKEMNVLQDQDLIDSMNSINNAAQYLSQTIDDFRDFFNPKNSKMKNVLINKTLEKAIALVSPQFSTKEIKIIKDIENIELNILENEFIQVLINILNNSRDALLEKNIDSERLIFIKVFKKNEKVNIHIYDNAKGIDESIINRIFEPYFTTKYKSQGTGIGLYMSQEIVEKLLKGKISVFNKEYEFENKIYKGACFKIELNLYQDLTDK